MLAAGELHERPLAPPRPIDVDAERPLTDCRALAHAIATGELCTRYQPIVGLATRQLVGAEVLVRWAHPALGLVGPDRFVALSEDCGLIHELTFAVIGMAARDARRWRASMPDLHLSVNLSPVMLDDPGLPERLARLLEQDDFPASSLTLEITEGRDFADVARTAEVLGRLREQGVRIALDDFGTGYSSYGRLFQFPYSEVKVDKGFVQRAPWDREAAAVVRSTIEFARTTDLDVVAEGVESAAAFRWLAESGCDRAQGFHIGRPMDDEAFVRWRAAWLAASPRRRYASRSEGLAVAAGPVPVP
jgi:EAL domain-containing protein (putative c-di-GMP-specific phosphodiesterase class I)